MFGVLPYFPGVGSLPAEYLDDRFGRWSFFLAQPFCDQSSFPVVSTFQLSSSLLVGVERISSRLLKIIFLQAFSGF
jgi:hypothetical protein